MLMGSTDETNFFPLILHPQMWLLDVVILDKLVVKAQFVFIVHDICLLSFLFWNSLSQSEKITLVSGQLLSTSFDTQWQPS